MNITEALAFDCVQANFNVQDEIQARMYTSHYFEYKACADFALKAHDAIAILQIEIKRLTSLPGNSTGACTAKHRYRDLTAVFLPACIDYNLDTGAVVCLPAAGQAGQPCGQPYNERWIRLVENKFSFNGE